MASVKREYNDDLEAEVSLFGRPFCKTVRSMLSDRRSVCLVCLSVTLVYGG